MAGPWEDYQSASKESGPWQDYAPSGPGRGGRKITREDVKAAGESNTPTDTSFGMPRLATGVDQLTNLGGNRPNQKLKGIHNVVTGAGEIASPLAVVPAVANPVGAAGALVGAAGGGAMAKLGANALGAPEDVSDVAGDAGALAGGYLGEEIAPTSKWLAKFADHLRERAAGRHDAKAAKQLLEEGRAAAKRLAQQRTGLSAKDSGPTPGQYDAPKPAAPEPINVKSLPEGVNPPAKISPKGKASLPKPKTGVNASAKPMPGKPTPATDEAQEATQAQLLGKFLRKAKIRPDDAAHIKPEEWEVIAKQANVNVPSEKVSQMALEENRKLWAASQKDLETRRAAYFAKQGGQ